MMGWLNSFVLFLTLWQCTFLFVHYWLETPLWVPNVSIYFWVRDVYQHNPFNARHGQWEAAPIQTWDPNSKQLILRGVKQLWYLAGEEIEMHFQFVIVSRFLEMGPYSVLGGQILYKFVQKLDNAIFKLTALTKNWENKKYFEL